MKVTVKVPATTANFGSGFDCFGMALPLYNIITIEETVLPGTGIEVNVVSEFQNNDNFAIEHIPKDENNIIYKAVEMLYNSIGQSPSELKITIKSSIPIAKGLGSSASIIVGGLYAANELLNKPADEAALLSIATEIEGHPDNVTPAIVGGFVITSLEDDGSIIYRKIDWPDEWMLNIFIPDYELVTEISRSVLPAEVPLKDAVFNSGRTAMFIEALHTHDEELMKLALQDKLHQPYRSKLVPGVDEIVSGLRHEEDVLGCTLSGAGPAILVISKKNKIDRVKSIVTEIWENYNVKTSCFTFKPELKGAEVLEVS